MDLRKDLIEIVRQKPPALWQDELRLKGLLLDHCAEHLDEHIARVKALAACVRIGLARDLGLRGGPPMGLILVRAMKRLHEEDGFRRPLAEWAVESWEEALANGTHLRKQNNWNWVMVLFGIIILAMVGFTLAIIRAFSDPFELASSFTKNVKIAKERRPDGLVENFEVSLSFDVTMRFVFIPSGKYRMGSDDTGMGTNTDECPMTIVCISSPFWISETETTQGQWRAIMGTGINDQRQLHGLTDTPVMEASALPMVYVSWDEANTYCHLLQQAISKRGSFRLPTEAEWEYACRGRTTTAYSFGDTVNRENANVATESTIMTNQAVPVRLFSANAWGLFDMHGNVGEWCSGGYVPYPGGIVTEWRFPETPRYRIFRGGSWALPPEMARSAQRNAQLKGAATNHVGFRVVWKPNRRPTERSD